MWKSLINAMMFAAILLILGCSSINDGNPATMTDDVNAPLISADSDSRHMLWSIWNIQFDETKLEAVVEPIRNAQAHYNVTTMITPPACDDCVGIAVNSFDPVTRIIDVDVTLRNPIQINGHDVRGILYTNDYGHELRNADDWTGLWDIPGGEAINPFKAFAKEEANRIFAALAEHTENYLVYIPIPPQYNAITFAVDASWPGNCEEPYEITNFSQETIYDLVGSTGNIYVDVCDWQDDVSKVTLVAPEITGEPSTQFTYLSGDTWSLALTNNVGADAGDYELWIEAKSEGNNVILYDKLLVTIVPYINTPPVWDDTIGIVLTEPGYEEVTVTFGTASDPDAPVTYNVYYSETSPIDFGTAPKEVFPSSPAVIDELTIEWTYYFAVRAQDALGLEDDNIIEMAETPADPCIDDQDPPDTFIDAGCEDQYTGTTEITLTVSGSDPFDCTEESNLLFEWRKKVQGDTWSDDWSSPVLGPSLIIDGLYDAGWDIQVRAIDEVANKDEIPAECSFTIGEGGGVPDNPVDVTPPWLNFSPLDVCTDGHYAYTAGGVNGLHIFNISDPANPVWVNRVDTPGEAEGIAVSGGYAYVADYHDGLQIIDIDPPESAYIVNSVDTPGNAYGVAVSGGYAYVADWDDGLQIIDIDSPESAYIVNSVDTPENAYGVAVSGGYAYVADWDDGLQIIAIDPPESAYIVKTVDTPGFARDVTVSDGYAYVADSKSGLQIIDIDPPESAYIINSVDTAGSALRVAVSSGYAYVADYHAGLQIIDIDPPESAYIVNSVDTPDDAYGVAVSGGYAYVADYHTGLQIIDIDPLESAYFVNAVDTSGKAYGVAFSSGYAYVADYYADLQIIDIDPPESAYIVKAVDTPDAAYGVAVSGGYAYVADCMSGLQIIDIDPPESAYIINAVDTPGSAIDVAVSGGYAYMTDGDLQIIDIDPPESAYIVNAVDTPGTAQGVAVSGGYAYVASDYYGLQIIDIDPPESAYIFSAVDTPDRARGVAVSGGYAYVADYYAGLQIIDIDPPELAYIVNSVDTPDDAYGVAVSGGYAYVADYHTGLQIIDIDPPESAYIFSAVDTPGRAYGVAVSGGYAYVADELGGLRIIKLW